MTQRRPRTFPLAEFPTLLADIIRDSGQSKQAFARLLHVRPSVISQMLSGAYPSPSLEICLQLAEVAQLPPGRVLRAAGRGELADLLDRAYAPGRVYIDASLPQTGKMRMLAAYLDNFVGSARINVLALLRNRIYFVYVPPR